MTEDQLLGPYAWGEPCGSAVFKAATEDFQVREQLHIPFSGNGEHLWLLIEKRALGTEDVARMLARAAGVALSEVSYAGLKDRQAVTSQWFSVRLPGRTDPDLSALWSDNLRCLQQTRHSRKLQRGAHNANRFLIRLHELQADRDALQQRLETLAAEGVPNYFGPQRFGIHGNNVDQARQWATRGGLPPARGTRSRLLSAARSLLFNQYLAQRVAAGSWNRVLDGDRLAFSDSRSHFAAADLAADDPRLAALDLHPTGPLWGQGTPASSGEQLQQELQLAGHEPQLCDWLEAAGLEQQRRILRLPIGELAWHYPSATCLQLEFTLPSGCFATAVVRELVSLTTGAEAGLQTDF